MNGQGGRCHCKMNAGLIIFRVVERYRLFMQPGYSRVTVACRFAAAAGRVKYDHGARPRFRQYLENGVVIERLNR